MKPECSFALSAPVRHIWVEPGDGTHYAAIVVGPLVGETECRGLGVVVDGYLVVCSITGKAYLFQGHGPLHPDYVAEKFGLRGESAIHFARLIADTIGHTLIGVPVAA